MIFPSGPYSDLDALRLALMYRGGPVPAFRRCPACGADFEPFLRYEFVRDWLFLRLLWARILRRPEPAPYALICRACKEIVAYERLPTEPANG